MKKEANTDSSAFVMLDHPVHQVLFVCFLGYHTRPHDNSHDVHEL